MNPAEIAAHPGLHVEALSIGFGATPLITDATFTISRGESVALMGRSGSGKSTLLWNLLGLLRPQAGSVTVAGQRITGASARKQADLRRTHLGVVFQQPQLIAEMTPVENVMTPLLLRGVPRSEANDAATAMLQSLGVPPREHVGQLSGGEQQRVSIARALVDDPAVVIADEPTASLDEDTAAEVVDALLAHSRDRNAAVLLVTHSSQVAARAERVMRVHEGRIIEA